jgi:MSHA biogenesis protein MshN
MSLINKMLQDLEARDQSTPGSKTNMPYQGLRPAHYGRRRSHGRLIFWALAVLAIAAAGYYFGDKYLPKTLLLAKSTEVPAVAPAASALAPLADAAVESIPAAMATSDVTPAPPQPAVEKPPEPVVAATEVKPAPLPVAAPVVATVPPKPNLERVAAPKPATQKPKPAAQAPTTESLQGTSHATTGSIEKHDRVLSPLERADAYYREAGALIEKGRAEDARATLNAALVAAPEHHKARELAAAVALQNGRTRDAQSLLEQGLKITPQHVPFAFMLARLQVDQGNEALAIDTLEGVRAAGTNDGGYLAFLAQLYQRAGRHADAVQSYRDAVGLRAQDARAWLGLGISLEATQDFGGAFDAYTRALQLDGLDTNLAQYARQRAAALSANKK